jgi:two-component system, LytTR family, response regulator
MIKTVVIDDEPLARSMIKEYLQAFSQLEIVQECGDGFEGVKAIMHHRPDLVFLDVQMPKINGFEMLELIEEPPAVIFVTAFDEYAIRAFESHAVDYLLKPFSKERFVMAVNKFLEQSERGLQVNLKETPFVSEQQKQRVVVRSSGKIRIIPIEEIVFLEAADDYVKIHTGDGVHLKKRTMTQFETMLDHLQFVRTHRSFIVNVQHITRIEPFEKENYLAILKNGKHIPVSRSGYTKLKEVLGL